MDRKSSKTSEYWKKNSYSVLEIVEMASCGTKGNIQKTTGAIMPELQEISRIMVEL